MLEDHLDAVSSEESDFESNENENTLNYEDDDMPDEEIDKLIGELAGMDKDRYKKKGGRRKKTCTLTHVEAKAFEEANDYFMNCNYEKAIELCKKIAVKNPHAIKPYSLLSLIYEEIGDIVNQANAGLLEAQLSTVDDGSKWKKLGQLFRKIGQPDKAIFCYNRSLKLNPDDIHDMWDRAITYSELGRYQRAVDGLLSILEKPGQQYSLQVAMEAAILYHQQLNMSGEGIALLEKVIPHNLLDFAALNILCELYIAEGLYEKARETCIHATSESDRPIELSVRIGVCSIFMNDEEATEENLNAMANYSVEEIPDLYIEVIEAYATSGEYTKALNLCDKLMESCEVNASLWYLRGKCESSLGLPRECIMSLETVLNQKNGCQSVDEGDLCNTRLLLSSVYTEIGEPDKALSILNAGDRIYTRKKGEKVRVDADSKILLQRCKLLLSLGKFDELLEVSAPALGRLFHHARIDEEREHEKGETRIWRHGYAKRLPEWLSLILDNLRVLIYTKKYEKALYLFQRTEVLSTKIKTLSGIKRQLVLYSFMLYYHKKEYGKAASCLRKIFQIDPFIPGLVEFIHRLLILNGTYQDFQKSVSRLKSRNPENIALQILNGHQNMNSSSAAYSMAAAEYLVAYHFDCSHINNILYLSIAFLMQGTKRSSFMKKSCLMSAFAFLFIYYEKRGGDQEACYNVGRAYHHIGLHHLAINYYKKCLKSSTPREPNTPGFHPCGPLTQQAAYNLARIYMTSGNETMSRLTLFQYCSI